MNILAFFWPQKIARISSKYNQEITVIEFLGKRYIDVGGLMQSGGFLEKIYSKGIKKLFRGNPRKILVLGLGGGSIIRVLNKFYPKASIDAVEIDEQMVLAGKKYLDLARACNLKIIIGDAFPIAGKLKGKYDFIFVDLYKGYEISKKVSEANFLLKLKALSDKNGSIIFNHIYFRNHISEANIFLDKLKKVFHYINTAKIYSNILVCVK